MPPHITAVTPDAGASSGRTSVTIQGTGFEKGAMVSFGAPPVDAFVVDVKPTEITAETPAYVPGPANITVTNPDHTSATQLAGFTFHAPIIAAIQPDSGPTAGATVTISGSYFAIGAEVSVGGGALAGVERHSTTQILATLPAQALPGPVNVTVTNPDGQTAVAVFTYQLPAIVSIDPDHGPSTGNTKVTITGTDFTANVTLAFGVAAAVAANADRQGTRVQGVSPAVAPGIVNVTVTNVDGQTANVAFTYDPPPTVLATYPASARTTGGRPVEIGGTGFVNGLGLRVTFDGIDATSISWINATTLHAVVPPHAAGQVAVTVTNPDGQQHVLPNGFTYSVGATVSDNRVHFLMDGEEFFGELRDQMDAMLLLPPHPATYVRMAFWMIDAAVTFGDRNQFQAPAHTVVEYVRHVLCAGHNVDIIVWYPNAKDRLKFRAHADKHDELADQLMHIGKNPGLLSPPAVTWGHVRIYLERYEGWFGSSNHQKMAIFSHAGQRRVVMGGFNLAPKYFDSSDHRVFPQAQHNHAWHDTAILLTGPATDDVEAEWMRRWQRAVAMQASRLTLNDLPNQVRSHHMALGSRNTIRQAIVAIRHNLTPQARPLAPDANVQILTTRAERGDRHRELSDGVLALINQANNYVYMENNQFTDPEIVRALYTRMETVPGLRVIVMTNLRDGGEGYLTRRSWLQLVLRLPYPQLSAVHYRSDRRHHRVVQVDRQNARPWRVHDCYDAQSLTQQGGWLTDDTLEIASASGGTKHIAFDRIVAVDCNFHFYTTLCQAMIANPSVPPDNEYVFPVLHSKLMIVDDTHAVIGSSNWTYRSMQYDGEIAAFIDCTGIAAPNFVTQARDRLIAHYSLTGTQLQLSNVGDNFELVAQQNITAFLACDNCGVIDCDVGTGICPTTGRAPQQAAGASFGGNAQYRVLPLVHPWMPMGDVRKPPGKGTMPSYTWI